MITIDAPAKINLSLAIIGKKGNKHLIDSIFIPFDGLVDIISLNKRSDKVVSIRYTDGRVYENDTAFLCAKKIVDRYDTNGCDIVIEKNIPEGKGLGGSSADAGIVARAMQKAYAIESIDMDLLLSIGSDVPYFYVGGAKRVKGLGEVIEDIDLPKMYIVIVVPKTSVSTKACYELYDSIGGDEGNIDNFIEGIKDGTSFKNALTKAACTLNADVESCIGYVKKAGFYGGMTGSGSAVFGVETNQTRFLQKLNKLKKYAKDELIICGK